MVPPYARVHLATDDPWSIVAPHRQPGLPSNRYKELRVSRLRHVNKCFSAGIRHNIKDVATHVDLAFRE